MNRTRALLAATGAAAALLLAACSSTGGSPTAGTTSMPAPATSSMASPTMTAGPTSSSGSTESADTGGPTQTDTTDMSDTGSTDSDVTTTIGANGNLDAQTTAWFTTFCTGLGPVLDLGDKTSEWSSQIASDPAAGMKAAGDYFVVIGKSFTDTAASLKSTPPPTFQDGAEVAGKIVAGMEKAGPIFTQAGQKLAALNPTDQAGAAAAMQELQTSMTNAMSAFGDVTNNVELDPATEAAVKQIPACSKFGG